MADVPVSGLAGSQEVPAGAGGELGDAPVLQPAPASNVSEPVETPEMQGIRAMADALVQCGGLTREQADKMIAADLQELRTGEPGAAIDLPKLADPLADLQLDPEFDRPATPTEYRFPPARAEGATLDSVREAQHLAWQARMPVPIAMEMFKIADGYTGNPLDSDAIALLSATNHAKLERLWGGETQAKIELGRRFIAELQAVNPRVMPLMDTGLGSDLGFVLLLVAHAERIALHRAAK